LRQPQISRILLRIPPHEEGRFAIVTMRGGGERWPRRLASLYALTNEPTALPMSRDGTVTKPVASALARGFRGRSSRVVLAPRRWR
jgi:hypothetical protein